MCPEIPNSLSRATTRTLSPHRHLPYRDTVLTKTLPQSRKKEAIATSVCKAEDGGKAWGARWLDRKGAYHNAWLTTWVWIHRVEGKNWFPQCPDLHTHTHTTPWHTHTHTHTKWFFKIQDSFLQTSGQSRQRGHTPRHPEVWDLYYAGRADQTVPCRL